MVFISREGAERWARANRQRGQRIVIKPVVKPHADRSSSFGFVVRFK